MIFLACDGKYVSFTVHGGNAIRTDVLELVACGNQEAYIPRLLPHVPHQPKRAAKSLDKIIGAYASMLPPCVKVHTGKLSQFCIV